METMASYHWSRFFATVGMHLFNNDDEQLLYHSMCNIVHHLPVVIPSLMDLAAHCIVSKSQIPHHSTNIPDDVREQLNVARAILRSFPTIDWMNVDTFVHRGRVYKWFLLRSSYQSSNSTN